MSRELARVPAADVKAGVAVRIEGGPHGICLVRVGDEVYALADRCSHENVPLSEGEVDAYECSVECWKHGSTFSLRTGEPQCLPATHPVAVYEVRRDGEDLVVTGP